MATKNRNRTTGALVAVLLGAGTLLVLASRLMAPGGGSAPARSSAAAAASVLPAATGATAEGTRSLRGRVRDRAGRPVPGAAIHAQADDGAAPRVGVADEAGTFALAIDAAGEWLVAAGAEGFLPEEVGVHVEGPTTEVVIVLDEAARLAGRVHGAGALEMRMVSIVIDGDGGGADDTYTAGCDADGSFEHAVKSGRYRVSAGVAGQILSPPLMVAARGGERAWLDIVLSATGGLAGRAWLPDGTHATAARLLLYEGVKPRPTERIVTLDEEGRFIAAGIVPGRYEARLEVADLASLDGVWVDVRAGALSALELEWPAGRVTGRLTSGGEPRADRTVLLQHISLQAGAPILDTIPVKSVRTDTEGRFSIAGVADGQYTVMSSGADGEGIAQVTLDAGRRSVDVDLRLDRGRPIAVQVRGRGQLGDVALFAFRLPLHDSVASASTDARGVGELDLTDGRYRVVARRFSGEDGRLEVAQTEIAVGPALAARPVELVLR